MEVITTADQKEAVAAYVEASAQRSERDRMSDVKTISGVFTGAYALTSTFTQETGPNLDWGLCAWQDTVPEL